MTARVLLSVILIAGCPALAAAQSSAATVGHDQADDHRAFVRQHAADRSAEGGDPARGALGREGVAGGRGGGGRGPVEIKRNK